jgi:serine/threonine protein kinase
MSVDGHLWCQDQLCPAGDHPTILEEGERLGDIEVTRLLMAGSTFSLYQAQRMGEALLLKLSHEGFEEKIKREAVALLKLQTHKYPALPVLLPAHQNTRLEDYPIGKVDFRGRVRFYELFEFREGIPMRQYLQQVPQPWYQHVGWLMIRLADTFALLHQQEFLHYCLSPESLLIRTDQQGIPRPLLIDLGCATREPGSWKKNYVLPAYTAPEWIGGERMIGPQTDVYGLGLLAFEMLAGVPAYSANHPYNLENAYEYIRNQKRAPRKVREDIELVPQLVERMLEKFPRRRPQSMEMLLEELRPLFPPLPREKPPRVWDWKLFFILCGGGLLLSLLCLTAILVGG